MSMMRMQDYHSLCLLGLLVLSIASASSWHHMGKVDEFITNLMKCKKIPGFSLAIVKDGRPLVSKGYGYANLESQQPVTSGTKFCVASLTKAFTATLLAQLLFQRGLNWDTPIRDILGPDFYISDDYRSRKMSLRDVLSHKSGFPSYDGLWMAGSMTPEEILRKMPFLHEEYGFRTKFTYNNIMYILAGVVAERLGGLSWWNLVKQRILGPLNMTHTAIAGDTEDPSFSKCYLVEEGDEGPSLKARPWKAIRGISSTFSAASICTTSEDIAKWMEFHMNAGDHLAYWSLLKEIYQPQTTLPIEWNMDMARPKLPQGIYYDYAMGWFTGRYRGFSALHHYGSMYDFFSSLNIIPYHKFGVFTSLNGAGVQSQMSGVYTTSVNSFVLDLLLQEETFRTPEDICEYDPFGLSGNEEMTYGGVLARPFFRRNLDPYIGTYGNNIFGNVTVHIDDATYMLHLQYGKLGRLILDLYNDFEYSIESENDWTLFCTGYENFGKFGVRKDGTVDSLTLPCLEPEQHPQFFRDHQIPILSHVKGAQGQVACVQSTAGGDTKRT